MAQKNVVEYILDIKTKAAEKGMKALSRSIDIAGKGLAGLKTASVAVAGATIALAGAVGVAVKEVTDLVNELNDLSVRSGLATDTISGLRFALVASGQSAEGLNEILGAISGQFAQLSMEGSAVEKKFASFGITVRDTNGVLRSNNDILLDVIKNITSLEDPSERSRRAVALIGEAGSKLNQALAAGDFEKFVELTNKFGVRVGPKASTEAANLQRNISALNSILAGTTQRFTEAIGGSERFSQILQVLIGVMGGVSRVIEENSVFLGHLTDAIFEAGSASLDFFAGFLTGTKSASQGIQGLVENIFIVGQAILRGLIIPLQGFVFAARNMSEFLDLEMTKSLKNLEGRLQELNKNLNINADEGFINFANFGEASAEVLDLVSQTSLDASSSLSTFSSSMKEAGEETGVTTEKIRTLTDVLNDLFKRFTSFDVNKFISDFSIIFNFLNKSFDQVFNVEKIDRWVDNLKDSFNRATTTIDFQDGVSVPEITFEGSFMGKFEELITKLKIGTGEAFSKAVGLLGKAGGKIGSALSTGISAGATTAITGILAVIGIASKLGQRGKTVAEIEKSVEEDIRARAKAIELGLQALPRILFNVLPPLFVEFADRIVFGFFKSIAEFVNILINGFKSIFTREGRQSLKEGIKEGFRESIEEFWRRINVVGGILSKRGGGRYIPSARGGIKFTGADEGLAMLHRGEFVVPETGQMPQAVQRTMGMGQGGMTININASVVESNAIDELVRQIERRFQTFGSSTSPLFGGR